MIGLLLLLLACTTEPGGVVADRTPVAPSTATDTGPQDAGTPLSYAADIAPLWQGGCTDGCHPGSDSMADLRPGYGYADLVDIPSVELPTMDRVQAGDPGRSYLLLKLEGTHIAEGGMGPPMPPSGALIPEADRDLVRRWILQGAPP